MARSSSHPHLWTSHDSPLQWAAVGLVGILLGIYVLQAAALSDQWMKLLLLAGILPFALMITGRVRQLLLLVILLDTSFAVDVNLLYQAEVRKIGTLAGFNVSATTVCLTALYVSWLGQILTHAKPLPHKLLQVSLAPGAYVVCVLLSGLVATSVFFALCEIAIVLQAFLLYVYLVANVRSQDEVVVFFAIFFASVVVHGLVIIAVYLTGQNFSFFVLSTNAVDTAQTGGLLRSGGFIGSPNHAASYLSLFLAPAVSFLCAGLGVWPKRLALFALGCGGIALLLTFSRGGWLSATLSMGGFCVVAVSRGWLSTKVLLAIGLLGLLILIPMQEMFLSRLLGDDNGSAYSRWPLIQIAFQMASENPLLGVGANNFGQVMKAYTEQGLRGEWLYTVHNKYMLVWAETGTVALLTFLSFLFLTLRRGWLCSKRVHPLAPLALGVTVAIAGHMTHMFVDMFHSRDQVQTLWVLAALITIMSGLQGERAWR